ncbi:hypothetical protein GN956_G20026 [Arapaima gigas]
MIIFKELTGAKWGVSNELHPTQRQDKGQAVIDPTNTDQEDAGGLGSYLDDGPLEVNHECLEFITHGYLIDETIHSQQKLWWILCLDLSPLFPAQGHLGGWTWPVELGDPHTAHSGDLLLERATTVSRAARPRRGSGGSPCGAELGSGGGPCIAVLE